MLTLDTPISTLVRHAAGLDEARAACRRALATSHLVSVASSLRRDLDASLEDLEFLGIPIDILGLFPAWTEGRRDGFRPPPLGLRPAPVGAAIPLRGLRIQIAPAADTVALSLLLLRNLLRATEPSLHVWVGVEPGARIDALQSLLEQAAPAATARVHIVEQHTGTVFAQDNARAAIGADGNPVLVVPRSFCATARHRGEDLLDPASSTPLFGQRTVRSLLAWEGGNLVHDTEHCVVGADTVRYNMGRFGLAPDEVLGLFAAEWGRPVHVLGDVGEAGYDAEREYVCPSGQASAHIDLDVSLLGLFGRNRRPRALVADAARGLELVSSVLRDRGRFAGQFLPPKRIRAMVLAEYEAAAVQRHPRLLRYAAALEKLGYHVAGMPDLRVLPEDNVYRTENLDFTYCNVLPALHRSRPAVYYLPWGMRELDEAAVKAFRKAGVEPVPLAAGGRPANALMRLSGGLRCFMGPIEPG
jgi:hypothetical protein